jgi:hypothetical protein
MLDGRATRKPKISRNRLRRSFGFCSRVVVVTKTLFLFTISRATPDCHTIVNAVEYNRRPEQAANLDNHLGIALRLNCLDGKIIQNGEPPKQHECLTMAISADWTLTAEDDTCQKPSVASDLRYTLDPAFNNFPRILTVTSLKVVQKYLCKRPLDCNDAHQ